jgi:hypothetical protein
MSTREISALSSASLEYSEKLQKALFHVLEKRGIKHAEGPAAGYFEEILSLGAARHIYVAFGQDGAKEKSRPREFLRNVDDVITAAVVTFHGWLDGNKTLFWRTYPEVEHSVDRGFTAYWRCVQIGDSRDPAEVRTVPLEKGSGPVELPTPARRAQRSTIELLKEMLEEAEAGNCHEIIMVGFMRDGDFLVVGSPGMNRTRRLGALEQAKFDTLMHHREET